MKKEELETLCAKQGISFDETMGAPLQKKTGSLFCFVDTEEHDESAIELEDLPVYQVQQEKDLPSNWGLPKEKIKENFVVKKLLGEGGYGFVELAEQRILGREVALKRTKTSQKEVIQSFLREARITSELSHPNIVPIHMIGRTDDDRPFIIMEKIGGKSWNALLKDEKPMLEVGEENFDLDKHLNILYKVCDAVSYAHEMGFVHRDIKPANVMVGDFGETYLLDWGIALDTTDTKFLHRIVGPPGYLPPEMARGDDHEVDPRTDIYLLGATLHYILTGNVKHPQKTIPEKLFSAINSTPFDYTFQIPDELANICNKATHQDKEKRFATVQDFVLALKNFQKVRLSSQFETKADTLQKELLQLLTCDDKIEQVALFSKYLETRNTYKLAVEMWEENKSSKEKQNELTAAMFDYELNRENYKMASFLYSQLEKPSDLQSFGLQNLKESVERQKRTLQKVEFEKHENADIVHYELRRLLFPLIGNLPLLGYIPFGGMMGNKLTMTPVICVLGIYLILLLAGKSYLEKNQRLNKYNKKLFGLIFFGWVMRLLTFMTFAVLNEPLEYAFFLNMLFGSFAYIGHYLLKENPGIVAPLTCIGLGFLCLLTLRTYTVELYVIFHTLTICSAYLIMPRFRHTDAIA